MVVREGQRHGAVTADPAVGRLHADEVAAGCRNPDRSAGIRTECAVEKPRRDRGTGSARRTAGDASLVPGIAYRSGDLVVSGRTERELHHVEAGDRKSTSLNSS